MRIYNYSYNRIFEIAPVKVQKKDQDRLLARMYSDSNTYLKPPIQQLYMVKISKIKGVFDKCHMFNLSKDYFKINDVPNPRRNTKRKVYKISDYKTESVKEIWYLEKL